MNSFGIGRTNCHMILEEYISHKINSNQEIDRLVLSVRSEASLLNYINKLILYLERGNISLNDFCYMMNTRRNYYEYRIAMIVRSIMDILKKLNGIISEELSILNHTDIFFSYQQENFIKKIEYNQIDAEDKEMYRSQYIKQLYKAFINGEKVNFNSLYLHSNCYRVFIPSVPLE